MTKVCIVGGSGFIGTEIANTLKTRGLPFTLVDIRDSQTHRDSVITADITKKDSLLEAVQGECIIHLAAVHRDDVRPLSLYDDVNIKGTENLCSTAEANGIERIIFASSVAVYGFAKPGADESGAIAPFNDYGRTKAGAEQVLANWHASDPTRRSLTIIRPTVVFGPGNRGNVYNLFKQIQTGRFVMIGPGHNRKSMAYVANIAEFFLNFTEYPPGIRTYNYVDGPDLTMNQLVTLVRKDLFGKQGVGLRLPTAIGYGIGAIAEVVSRVTGRRLPISRVRAKKFVSTTSFATKLADEHGFQPKIALEDAIHQTLDAEFIHPDPNLPEFVTE